MCVSHVRELSEELNSFVFERSMMHSDDENVVSDAYHSIKKLYDRSEEERSLLESERNKLLRQLAGMNPSAHCYSNDTDDYEDEAKSIRSRIATLKEDLGVKQCLIKELVRSHEMQIRRIESANREEVRSLREAVSHASEHSDKWKSMYMEDVPRLREQLCTKLGGGTVELTKRPSSKSC